MNRKSQEIEKRNSLIVLDNCNVKRYHLVRKENWLFGRDAEADIKVSNRMVARRHGIFLQVDETWSYCDLSSANGTYVNGKRIENGFNGRSSPVLLSTGDCLSVAREVLMLFLEDSYGQTWNFYPLPKQMPIYIGRSASLCQIVQEQPYISNQHAKFTYMNGSYYVEDCQSRNGVFVNQQKIEAPVLLQEKDVIRLCDYYFIFTQNGLYYNTHVGASKSEATL